MRIQGKKVENMQMTNMTIASFICVYKRHLAERRNQRVWLDRLSTEDPFYITDFLS